MLVLSESQLGRARRRLDRPQFGATRARLAHAAAQLGPRAGAPALGAPPAGIAGWNHDYFCPEHHAPLRFDPASPRAHRCSAGGELHEDERYEAAWWRKVNLLLAQGAYSSALLWRLAGDPQQLADARRVLLDYAGRYPGYEIHGEVPYNGPGKANCQTLDEATWIIPLAQAYALIAERLPDDERRSIARDLLECCAGFLAQQREQQLHNHACPHPLEISNPTPSPAPW